MYQQQVKDFRKTFQALEKSIESQVASCCPGLSIAQCHALTAIDELGSATVGELAARLELDRSTVSRTVEGLVRAGVATRRRGVKDRRIVRIQLSETGKSLSHSISKESDEYYRHVLEHIPVEDLEAVLARFTQLVEAFKRHEARRAESRCCGTDS